MALGIYSNGLRVSYTVTRTGAHELPFQKSCQTVDHLSHTWIEFFKSNVKLLDYYLTGQLPGRTMCIRGRY